MKPQQQIIQHQFFEEFESYLSERSEKSLAAAYELGRDGIAEGIGTLDFLHLYHEALSRVNLGNKKQIPEDKLEAALTFLSECLAPYEMRQRGYKDMIIELNKQNKQLQKEIERRKQTEKELKKSKEDFQLLIENALDIIMVLDYDGTIRFASPSVERLLGYKPKEQTGQALFDYIHPEEIVRVRRELKELAEYSASANTTEFRIRHKDGTWRYLENIAKNVVNIRGGPGVIVNSRDVTDRFTAHQELMKSQQQLAAAQKIALLGSWE